jgi:hypothetical protein
MAGNDGMFGAVAGGAGSGAGMGASIGGLLAPLTGGLSVPVGAAVGAVAGGISGGVKQNKANEAQQIPLVDPLERARLAELAQMRKNISSGTDTLTQQGIQQQRNIGKAAQTALSRNTGGDVGQTMNALLQSQKATQGGVNQTIAQTQNRIPYFDSAQGSLMGRISDRKLQLARLFRDQKVAENAQARTDNNVNTQSLLATEGGTQTIPEGLQGLKGMMGSNTNISVVDGTRNVTGLPDNWGSTARGPIVPAGPEVGADAFSKTQPFIPTAPNNNLSQSPLQGMPLEGIQGAYSY